MTEIFTQEHTRGSKGELGSWIKRWTEHHFESLSTYLLTYLSDCLVVLKGLVQLCLTQNSFGH